MEFKHNLPDARGFILQLQAKMLCERRSPSCFLIGAHLDAWMKYSQIKMKKKKMSSFIFFCCFDSFDPDSALQRVALVLQALVRSL